MLAIQGSHIARRPVVILNPLGLHLRAADQFVRLAVPFGSEIRVCHDGRAVNGKSLLDLTTLAAACGSGLDLEARGPDAEAALAALTELISSSFHKVGEDE